MSGKDTIILKKLLGYIDDIFSYTQDSTFDGFQKDRMRVSATAFALGQIGELSLRISDDARNDNPDIPWHEIRGLRNRIIHDYDNVDLDVVWEVICYDLPKLAKQIRELM